AGAQFVTGIIRRHPIDFHVGYQHLWGKVGLEAELAGVIDPVTKEFTVYCDEDVAVGSECDAANSMMPFELVLLEAVNTAYGLAPKLRFVVKPASNFTLHLGAGIDVFTRSNHELVCDVGVACYPLRELLLAPRIVRAVFQVGFQFLI
ncbi:MAG: hypothetical protein ACPG77_20970, partial [Nannocystaceae bacterium]